MKRTFQLFSLLLSFIIAPAFGQDDLKTNLTQKWMGHKITSNENGKPLDIGLSYCELLIEFKKDGTYKMTTCYKKGDKEKTIKTVGQWQLSSDNKKIICTKNKFLPPNDKSGACPDYELIIIKIASNSLVTEQKFTDGKNALTTYYYPEKLK